jgi:hypothetical protein
MHKFLNRLNFPGMSRRRKGINLSAAALLGSNHTSAFRIFCVYTKRVNVGSNLRVFIAFPKYLVFRILDLLPVLLYKIILIVLCGGAIGPSCLIWT